MRFYSEYTIYKDRKTGLLHNKVTIKIVLNKFYVFSHKNNNSNVMLSRNSQNVQCGGHLELIKMLNDTKTSFLHKKRF